MIRYKDVKDMFSYDAEKGVLYRRGKKLPDYIEVVQLRLNGVKKKINKARLCWMLHHEQDADGAVYIKNWHIGNVYTISNLSLVRPKKLVLRVSHSSITDYSCVRWREKGKYKQKSFSNEESLSKFINSFGSGVDIVFERHRNEKL